MIKRLIVLAVISLSVAVLAACAQIIGIDDLPQSAPDAMPEPTPDAMPSIEPALVSLSVSGIAPAITLMPDVTEYAFDVPLSQQSVTVTATTNAQAMSVTINGKPVVSGMPSEPIPLALDENPIDVVVSGANAAMRSYLLILRRADQLAQYAYVKASNTGSNDEFSNAIAVSGDTIAVGAFNEDGASAGINGDQGDGAGQDYGAVYVFRRVGNVWAQEAYIKASNPDAGDKFGFSLALLGDTLAVGAPGEDSAATTVNGDELDNSLNDKGAVYVFRREGTAWQQEAYIKTSNSVAGNRFGESVALADDILAVGAPGPNFRGSAYVFRRSETVWQQEAGVAASNPDDYDYFGASVAISADTLVVGAPKEDSAGNAVPNDNTMSDAGAVYVFRHGETGWQQQEFLKKASAGIGDAFGSSLAISNDLIAIGVPGESSSARGVNGYEYNSDSPASGAVYLLRRGNPYWQRDAYIKSSNNGMADRFGISVALSGNTLVVGAYGEDGESNGVGGNQESDTASDSGAVYVFRRPGSEWLQDAYLKASNTGAGDSFGSSLAVSGDTVVVGAFNEDSASQGIGSDQRDNSATSSGAVYVFH